MTLDKSFNIVEPQVKRALPDQPYAPRVRCSKCMPRAKLPAIWRAHYSINGTNIHQSLCADHAKKAPQDGLIGMEFIG